jgi:hypothetical protein
MIPIFIALLLFGIVACYITKKIVAAKRKKRKQLDLSNAYQRMILQHRVVVEFYEAMGNRVLILDRRHKKLIAIDHNEPTKQEVCISLLSISETRVIEEKNKEDRVEKVFLELKHKRSCAFYRICFFNHTYDESHNLPCSARRALYWKNRIDLHKYPGVVSWGQEYVL